MQSRDKGQSFQCWVNYLCECFKKWNDSYFTLHRNQARSIEDLSGEGKILKFNENNVD